MLLLLLAYFLCALLAILLLNLLQYSLLKSFIAFLSYKPFISLLKNSANNCIPFAIKLPCVFFFFLQILKLITERPSPAIAFLAPPPAAADFWHLYAIIAAFFFLFLVAI